VSVAELANAEHLSFFVYRNNANCTGMTDVFTRCLLAVGKRYTVYHNVKYLARVDLTPVNAAFGHINILHIITSKYYFIFIQNNYTPFFPSCKDFFADCRGLLDFSIA
jgi:hypothetical protein